MPTQTFFNLPDEKRETLLNIAINEFADNGYHQASVSRMVEKAGIAKGSFYQYFENKKELYLYLLDLTVQEKLALIQQRQPPDPQMDLWAYLRWLFTQQTEFELQHPRLAEVAYRAYFKDVPFPDETLERTREQTVAYFRQLVEHGQASGAIDPLVDADLATFFFVTLFTEFGTYLLERLKLDVREFVERAPMEEKRDELDRLYDQFIYILQHGLGNQSSDASEAA